MTKPIAIGACKINLAIEHYIKIAQILFNPVSLPFNKMMKSKVNKVQGLIFVGSSVGTSWSRFEALNQLVENAQFIRFELFSRGRVFSGFSVRCLLLCWYVFYLNSRVLYESIIRKEVIFWLDKPIWLLPPVLLICKRFSGNYFVQHNTDYLNRQELKFRILYSNMRQNSKVFHANITCNERDLSYFGSSGHSMICSTLGYDNSRFYPGRELEVSEFVNKGLEGTVVFIGHWENRTETFLRCGIEAGFPINVYGSGWRHSKLAIEFPDQVFCKRLTDHEYEFVLGSALAAVSIPSEVNSNDFSGRTFEIPAMKTLLLAFETDGQLDYFTRKEALFFSNDAEFVSQLEFIFDHPRLAKDIAEKGYVRCVKSGYSWADIVKKELVQVLNVIR